MDNFRKIREFYHPEYPKTELCKSCPAIHREKKWSSLSSFCVAGIPEKLPFVFWSRRNGNMTHCTPACPAAGPARFS
jgi:hypothetical protein